MNVERRDHPRGEAGTRISLEEAANRSAEGRLDPRVRAWAIEKLVQAGNPKDVKSKAGAILDALRRERIYVPDPVDADFMPSAACTLKGCYGLTFLGEDCDGLLISFLAACMSVGIDGAVVGHGYPDIPNDKGVLTGFTGQLSHVLAAVHDPKSNQWILADPSTDYPIGTAYRSRRERWMHAVTGRLLCDSLDGTCNPDGFAQEIRMNIPTHGTFVGVGAPPEPATAGGQLGAAPAATLDPSKLLGLGDPEAQASMASAVVQATARARDSLYQMIVGHNQMAIVRQKYLDRPISDPDTNLTPPPHGIWTQAEEDYYQQLVAFTKRMISYGDEVAAGVRPVAWDTQRQEIVIIGQPGEPSLSITPNGDMSISDLPPDQQAIVPSVYGELASPIIYGIYIAMIFIGSFLVVDRICTTIDNRTNYALQTDLTTFHDRVYNQTGDIKQADESTAKIADASAKKAQADAEKEKQAEKPFEAFADIAKGAVYAAAALGVLYIGGKVVLDYVLPSLARPKQLKRA